MMIKQQQWCVQCLTSHRPCSKRAYKGLSTLENDLLTTSLSAMSPWLLPAFPSLNLVENYLTSADAAKCSLVTSGTMIGLVGAR